MRNIFKRDKMKHPHAGMVVKSSGAEIAFDVIIWVLLLGMTFIFLVPFWHVVMSSFSEGSLLIAHEGIVWWPITSTGSWNFGGYEMLFNYSTVFRGYLNTIIYVVAGTSLGLVINVIGGYCMYRKSLLQKFFVVYVLITMLFSGGLIPTFVVVNKLGLVNTPFAVILTSCTSALYVILAMNAFRGVNQATVEAAELDGAGHLRIMFQIMLPQCLSMMSVTILFTVVGLWNSWFEAKVYLPTGRSEEWWPLQLVINRISEQTSGFMQETNPDWNKYILTYTVIIAATVPILVIATIFQKYIERGVVLGGVKE